VWSICWKVACPASFCHSTTVAPDALDPNSRPEIVTACPSFDGSGAEEIVGLDGHWSFVGTGQQTGPGPMVAACSVGMQHVQQGGG
jgi:hypothetical protein